MKGNGNFDKIAWCYDLLSFIVFGNSIRKSQIAHLDQIPGKARILVIGGGTGWLLEEIFKHANPISVDYIELSGEMLSLARKKLSNKYKPFVEFICGDENAISSDRVYDVVITNFFLDLFKEKKVCLVMEKLSRHLQAQGIWIYTDFRTKEPESFLNKSLLKAMYLFFGMLCHIEASSLPPVEKVFKRLGMHGFSNQYFFFNNIHSILFKRSHCKG